MLVEKLPQANESLILWRWQVSRCWPFLGIRPRHPADHGASILLILWRWQISRCWPFLGIRPRHPADSVEMADQSVLAIPGHPPSSTG
jgi:hypothetical protein